MSTLPRMLSVAQSVAKMLTWITLRARWCSLQLSRLSLWLRVGSYDLLVELSGV